MAAFQAPAQTRNQNLNFQKITNCFASSGYPDCLFDMLDNSGYERIDKQYLEYCDRVIYGFINADGRPSVFFNPTICPKPIRSELYPLKVKNELEIQFQKSGRPYFENLYAQIRKTCKALPDENGTVPGPKSKTTKRVYRHEASGITFLVVSTAPVAYIYLLK